MDLSRIHLSRPCPLCGGSPALSVRRAAIPVLQNVTYATRAEAIAAPQAPFVLGTCGACGFSYNAVFDAGLVTYDARYDNHVASSVFDAYYRDLARTLIARFALVDGAVYDVGCGNGGFLRVLCELAPGLRGIGIDPSCTPGRRGNVELIRAEFDASLFADDARLVLLRHVLEHIAHPRDFLAALRAAMPQAPLYVEVPDLDWILRHGAFWDFCYEHCNYFTQATLAHAMAAAGFAVAERAPAFGGQYQWAIGLPARHADLTTANADDAVAAVHSYAVGEVREMQALRRNIAAAGGAAIWGMATKGVLLAVLLGEQAMLGGIDMNPGKQGRFAAGSGVAIHPPAWLRNVPSGTWIVVMNPNYLKEIEAITAAVRRDLVVAPI